ncbi:hypothetical protein EDC01DRAFT_638252 [Geopyxis carbonaria]|nr:hypothetical protein EDC01DRAFT_638252 [Geopyxis carbonaria]
MSSLAEVSEVTTSSAVPLNPTPPVNSPPPATTPAQPAPQEQSLPASKDETKSAASSSKPEGKAAAKPSDSAAEATGEKPLTAKELKEKKKAEKAARRVQNKAEVPQAQQKPQNKPQQKPTKAEKQQQQKTHKKNASRSIVETVYVDQSGKQVKEVTKEGVEVVTLPAKDMGLVGLLHELELEQNEKKKKPIFGIDNAHVDVHPAILTLGMQINQRTISGSSARCMGFLLAIKRLIEDYTTPHDSSLNRHLPGQYLSHQINYITSARPMAVAMGNAIRWLKTEISKVSPDSTDEEAKNYLCDKIDSYIHEKLTAADEMIINTACSRYISDGDVILTFSKSQVVEKTLLEAHRIGKQFRVIIADNRPLFEGRNILSSLCQAGIDCTYIHLYTLDHAMSEVTKVFLGTHAVMADGALYSRSGTAETARAAQGAGIPVIVCCETIKFSEKINIDGVVNNELGHPDALVNTAISQAFPEPGYLHGWKDNKNSTASDFVYDVTPSDCVSMVICEHGCVTPEGVSGVLRVSGGVDR